jgi:hypothetical protein
MAPGELVQAYVVAGTIDYRVKFVKGHAYLYERTYVGSAGDSKPVRTERYLGRVDDVRARDASQLELKFMAIALAREQGARKGPTRSEAALRPRKASGLVRGQKNAGRARREDLA